jgi:hypothetical protein
MCWVEGKRVIAKIFQVEIIDVYQSNFESNLAEKLTEAVAEALAAYVSSDEPDLSQLEKFVSSERNTLLTARDGHIDLAPTAASDEDLAPRIGAATLAVEDLVEGDCE